MVGFTASICAMCASTTARDVTCRVRMRRASSTPDNKSSSSITKAGARPFAIMPRPSRRLLGQERAQHLAHLLRLVALHHVPGALDDGALGVLKTFDAPRLFRRRM